jgi:hypothetical protein
MMIRLVVCVQVCIAIAAVALMVMMFNVVKQREDARCKQTICVRSWKT